jgi:hypothetical protein
MSHFRRESSYRAASEELKSRVVALLAGVNKTELNGETVLTASVRAEINARALYDSNVTPLAELMLNPNYIANTTYTQNPRTQRVLSEFNFAIVTIMQADPELLIENNFFQRYWAAVSHGCRRDEPVRLRDCDSIRFFMTDHNTSRILQFYAWSVAGDVRRVSQARDSVVARGAAAENVANLREADEVLNGLLRSYYQIISVAMLTSNRNVAGAGAAVDTSDILLLNGAVLYANYLSSIPGIRDRSRYMEHHVANIRSVIARAPQKLSDPRYAEAFRRILVDNNFWSEYSRRKTSQFSQWGTDLFTVASDPRLRSGEQMQAAILRSLRETDAVGQPGILKVMEDVRQSKQMEILNLLEADINFEADEYLYIVDQLFRGHWNVDDASLFWTSISSESADNNVRIEKKRKLLVTIEKYMKFQIVRMVVRTNDFMGNTFSDPDSTSGSMFRDAVEKSESIGNVWRDLLTQIRDFETFTKRYAKESDPSRELEEYRRLERAYANMKKNISILAVYPNMLVLSYIMAKERFSMQIRTWFGIFTLDAELIINWLFAQISDNPPRPWFNFGNEDKPIKKYENLYSFFFALKTKVFDTISEALARNGKNIEINPKEFLKVLVEKFTNTDRVAMRDYVNRVESAFRANSEYNATLQLCSEEQRVERERAEGNSSPRPPVYTPVKISFDKASSYTFIGRGNYGDDMSTAPVQNFYKLIHSQQLAIIRIFLAGSMTFLNTMTELMDKHEREILEKETDPAKKATLLAEHEKALDEIRASFNEVRDLKRRTYSNLLRRVNETRDCLDTLYRVERRQQGQMYDMMIDHLLSVHQKLKALKDFEATRPGTDATPEQRAAWATQLGELEARLTAETQSDTYLFQPGDVRLYDRLTVGSGYTVSNWDTQLRSANYLERINPNVTVERPDPATLINLDIYRMANAADARMSFPYVEDADQFVNSVLKGINGRFIRWASHNNTAEPFKHRLNLIVELYRANEMKIFRDDFTTCERNSTTNARECNTQMPANEITERDVVDEVFRLARFFSIDDTARIGKHGDTEATYFRRIGVNRRVEHRELQEFFLEERSFASIPLFDSMFKRFAASVPYLDEAKVAIETLEAMRTVETEVAAAGDASAENRPQGTGELIFLSNKDLVRTGTIEQFAPSIVGTIGSINKLSQAIRSRAEQDRENPAKFVFELDLSAPGLASLKSEAQTGRDGIPVYLDPIRLQDFATVQRQFHVATKNHFQRFLRNGE